jgi:hypothetical protein
MTWLAWQLMDEDEGRQLRIIRVSSTLRKTSAVSKTF